MIKKTGFTFIDVIVGTALVLLVFLGIFGAYQLGMKVVGQSKARITATALANQKIEQARNLPYKNVGTVGGIPPGAIPETATTTRNNIDYTIKTTVVYIDDPCDGVAPDDFLATDYKRVKVKVSWAGRFGGEVILITDVAPKGIETTEGGGTLSIFVFNASGQGVSQADVRVVNTEVIPSIDVWYQTNFQGDLILPGAPTSTEAYQITVTKSGYSTGRTYDTQEVANPSKSHATVLEGKLTEISFSIDELSTKKIDTVEPPELKSWEDLFDNTDKVFTASNASTSGGEVKLGLINSEYQSSGYLISTTITPEHLMSWKQFTWTDTKNPPTTDITYQALYFDGVDWAAYNSATSTPPIDLSGLNPETYSEIRIKANLSTANISQTPTLSDWKVEWLSVDPIPDVAFYMRGTKIIGGDADGNPVFKHSITTSTDAQGHIDITNLEWDLYTISTTTGYDISASNPPQPVDVAPGTTCSVTLTLVPHEEHTLLVTVTDNNNNPLEGATTTLSKTSYEKTLITGSSGQSFFTPLNRATYDLEVCLTEYATTTVSVEVEGQTEARIIMTSP